MTKEEIDLNCKYGTMFSFDTSAEYAAMMTGIYDELGMNYERNACNAASTACQRAKNAILRDLTRGQNDVQKRITVDTVEHHKDVVYKYFSLGAKDQKRVEGLIDKLIRERHLLKVDTNEVAA